MSGNEVTDECQDCHNHVLSNGNDVRPCDFGHGDTTVGLVGGIEVDMIRSNTRSYSNLQLFGLGKTFGVQIPGMETDCYTTYKSMALSSTSRRLGTTMINIKKDGTSYGVVMMTSASTSSWSNFEPSPSLSEVVTSVWP